MTLHNGHYRRSLEWGTQLEVTNLARSSNLPVSYQGYMKCSELPCAMLDLMAVTWAALGLLAVISVAFMGITWNHMDNLAAELRSEVGQLRSDVASEIGLLRSDVTSEMGQLRSEIGRLDAKFEAEIGQLRSDVTSGMGQLRSEIGRLDAKIDGLGAELRGAIVAQSLRIDNLATTLHGHSATA